MYATLKSEDEAVHRGLYDYLSRIYGGSIRDDVANGSRSWEDGWASLAEAGWLSLLSRDAGLSAWPGPAIAMMESFGRLLVAGPVATTAGYLVPLLSELRTDGAAELLERINSGRVIAPVIPGPKGDVDGLRLEEGLLIGSAPVVPFASACESIIVVLAPEAGDWKVLEVAADARGLSIARDETIDPGIEVGSVQFAGAYTVVADGPEVRSSAVRAVQLYGLTLDAMAAGGSEVLIERTVDYVNVRRQFGTPVGSFQAVKHKLATTRGDLEACRSLREMAAWMINASDPQADVESSCSRIANAGMFRRCAEVAIQLHGGAGFTWEQGLHFWYRSAMVSETVLTNIPALTEHIAAALARSAGGAE